jgi:cobalt-zinc-cadmium efflux system outer membrane protein
MSTDAPVGEPLGPAPVSGGEGNTALSPPAANRESLGPRVLNLATPEEGWRVDASATAQQTLTWPAFIHEVLSANLNYAAARYNVDMAAADAAAARLLPNPTLTLGGDRDMTFHDKYAIGTDGNTVRLKQVENRNVGITQTVQWWGKRKWAIRAADQALHAAAATLEDFLRNLTLDAATAYSTALAAQRSVDQLKTAAGFLGELRQAQEIRLKDGDIGRPDLLATQIEEREFLNDLSKAEDAAEAARYALSTYLGRDRGRTDFIVTGELSEAPHAGALEDRIADILKNRPDLVALRHARDAAESGVKLAKASVIPDVDVSLSYGYNSSIPDNHPIDPTPGFHQATLGLSIPLPVFDRGQAAIPKAIAAADQARAQLAAAELQAESDIRAAIAQLRSAQRRMAAFDEAIIHDADALLEARLYGYRHGANSLLDLLDAQRSDNQIRQDRDQAQADLVSAMIQLERVTYVDQGIHF